MTMQVPYGAGLWSFLSWGTEVEAQDAVVAAAGGAPNMVTTPEAFRALIASQRAERAAAELSSSAGVQVTPEQWRGQLAARRALRTRSP